MLEQPIISGAWFSIEWFLPQTLLSFSYARVYLLLLIPVIPLLFILRYSLYNRYRQRIIIAPIGEFKKSSSAWLRFIPGTLLSAAMALFLLAFARPQKQKELFERIAKGIDIVLAVDVSESMSIIDLKPNRLQAAKVVCNSFLKNRKQDRFALVAFAQSAIGVAPLSNDADLIESLLNELNFETLPQGGTAIGTAIGVSTNKLRSSKAKSKVIILLSDGNNSAGNIDPETAAKLAAAFGIKIYTIMLGKNGIVEMPLNADGSGGTEKFLNAIDDKLLKQIARLTNGKYFSASDVSALEKIFAEIDKLEVSEVKLNTYIASTDYYSIYLLWGLLLLLLWFLSKATFLANAMED